VVRALFNVTVPAICYLLHMGQRPAPIPAPALCVHKGMSELSHKSIKKGTYTAFVPLLKRHSKSFSTLASRGPWGCS
jgi:hypothetical protein